MTQRLGLIVCLALAACAGGTAPDVSAALLTADEVREGCVASTLDVMQGVLDLFAPATAVDSPDGLAALAQEAGCTLIVDAAGTTHTVSCPGVMVRGESVALTASVTFLAVERLVVSVQTEGGFFATEADLELSVDLERGIVVDGFLRSESPDGCVVEGTLSSVAVRTIADLPGVGFGALFTSGSVELDVTHPGLDRMTGTAALAGRSALVALEVAGIFSHGEISLG
ncbi:MAG: hypothetical protein ACYS0K_13925 [Planctomycetota bacterium]|jgi:hypothetical protein